MTATPAPLSRAAGDGRPAAPVRIAHLGLGNFFRAHQAWYTDRAPDADRWGIAAFTGRSPALADALTTQDGLYTLVERAPEGDVAAVVSSLSRTHPGGDAAAWTGTLADPALALVTLTVTEAGYRRGPDGGLDLDDPAVRADLDALRHGDPAPVTTAPGRLVAGLAARRSAGSGGLTLVPCDNLPGNGEVVARVVGELAGRLDPGLAAWIEEEVDVVTTMVDRITPATTDGDRDLATRLTGRADRAPVVTEPFAEWILAGRFRAGRPAWDAVGARFVDDIAPYEHRKLWLLNGGHSLLAYAASARDHDTVAQAVGDPECRAWVQAWWDEAAGHLSLPGADLADYRAALLQRWDNPRIQHQLAQIAADGSQKLPIRVVPVLRAERAAGRLPTAALRILAAWINHLRGAGTPVRDVDAARLATLVSGPLDQAVPAVLATLDPGREADRPVVDAVTGLCRSLAGRPGR